MREKFIISIATLGGLGYSRIAPGTMGSLAAATLYLLIRGNALVYFAGASVLLMIGFLVSGRAGKTLNAKDPRPIVIDEACGFLIAMFLIPFTYYNLLIVFLIFRTVDIIKPFPIRRLEKLPGSLGIMGDDILAGIYANLIFRLIAGILA